MTIAGSIAAALTAVIGAQDSTQVRLDADDIGGVVRSAKGPEAGVWVIAETGALQTTFRKIVVTDDQGRFVVPDLPRSGGKPYNVWVRGYGLVDSRTCPRQPGQTGHSSGGRRTERAGCGPDLSRRLLVLPHQGAGCE